MRLFQFSLRGSKLSNRLEVLLEDPSPHGRILILILLSSFLSTSQGPQISAMNMPSSSNTIENLSQKQGLTTKSPSSWHRPLAPILKFNSFFESLGLVPQSSDTEVVCTNGDDGEVMFIELIRKNDDSSKGEHEEEGSTTTEGVIFDEKKLGRY
ncbi:hypothetical protein Tco_0228945 [Tanacetum coccineum]